MVMSVHKADHSGSSDARNRRGRTIVPGAPSSSLYDGPTRELNASSLVESAIAANNTNMEVEEKSLTSKADRRTARVGPKSFKDKVASLRKERGEKDEDCSDSNSETTTTSAATSAPPSICGTPLPQRSGRGRPETTGQYRILKELKKRKLEEDELRVDQEVISPSHQGEDHQTSRELSWSSWMSSATRVH